MLRLQSNRYQWTQIVERERDDAHGKIVVGGLSGRFTSDEAAPRFVALVDNLHGVLFVLSLTREREGVLGLSVGDLVDPDRAIR